MTQIIGLSNARQPSLSRRALFFGATVIAAFVCGPGAAISDEPPGRLRRHDVAVTEGLSGIQCLLQSPEPVTWVFTGDSITHGALHTLGWRSYPEHFAERVRWELARVRDVVINTGISGDRTGGILKDFSWRVARFEPDVVSLMFGMNDCGTGPDGREAFRANLLALIDRVQAARALPLLHTPNTVYWKNSQGREDLPAYAQIIREVAEQRGVAVVDHYAEWSQAKPDQESLLPWLQDQSIHPGVYGHRVFARGLFRALGIYDDKSPTCALDAP